MKCPKCGTPLPYGAVACSKCGAKFKTAKCPHCGRDIIPGSPFCPACRKDIKWNTSNPGEGPAPNKKKPLTKRWWFWAVCVVLVLGIIGNIGNAMNNSKSGSGKSAPIAASPTPEAGEDNVFMAAAVHEADVMNGTKTSKIGTWAYINIDKAAAKAASPEDYAEFAKNTVSGSGYNWFSITFEDGTGITFTGCLTYLATYGTQDDEGCIVDALGDISLNTNSGVCSYTQRALPSEEPTASPPEKTPESSEPSATVQPAPESSTTLSSSNEPSQPTKAPQAPESQPSQASSSTESSSSLTKPVGGTVYWTPNGEKYHSTSNCVSLKRSSSINSGTLEEAINSGHNEPCKLCH